VLPEEVVFKTVHELAHVAHEHAGIPLRALLGAPDELCRYAAKQRSGFRLGQQQHVLLLDIRLIVAIFS